MGFDLYFAGSQNKKTDVLLKSLQCCRLFSQCNERNSILDYANSDVRGKLFIDSGAFSVAHSGKEVNIDEYIQFINSRPDIDVWAQLDSIPYPVLNSQTAKKSSEESWTNYLYMMDRIEIDKDKLLPIFHFGEPFDHLKRILNTEVHGKVPDYIGVGGRHGVSSSEQDIYFDNIFKIVKSSNNPNVKIHAFGMTVLKLLEKYPFYSADSTTWLMIGVNGGIMDDEYGIINISNRCANKKENFLNYPQDVQEKLKEKFKKFGYTYEEMSENYVPRLLYNIKYLKNWADNYVCTYNPSQNRLRRLF